MPLSFPWCFCIYSSGLDVVRCQIVNTPLKAAKDFYSRIERLSVFRDSVFLEFKHGLSQKQLSFRCSHKNLIRG
ncbi:hypothetical protein CDG79_35690 [Nostoc sp. 'Peltigera membranacea cyanobiont' 232]|nr:hypothetical protein CDG79_35690 [Nostoc sp. 'Peltigera membranacea cyanobiont' 232]